VWGAVKTRSEVAHPESATLQKSFMCYSYPLVPRHHRRCMVTHLAVPVPALTP